MSKPSFKDKYIGIMRQRALDYYRAKAEMEHCFPNLDSEVEFHQIAHFLVHRNDLAITDMALATTAANAERIWGPEEAERMYADANKYAESYEFVVDTAHDEVRTEPREANIPEEFLPRSRYQA